MNEEIRNVAGQDSSVATTGAGTANSVSREGKKNTAVRWRVVGYLERERKAVCVVLETPFSGMKTLYIPAHQLRTLAEDRRPAELVSIREGIDGTEVIERVGTVYRSRSGRALMISSSFFAGAEVMATWEKFAEALSGKTKKARISLPEAAPPRPAPVPAPQRSNIREGLAGGF